MKKNNSVSLIQINDQVILENSFIKVIFRNDGRLVSLFDKRIGQEAIEPGKMANQFVIFEDIPMYWDAWDVDVYHLEKRSDIQGGSVKIIETNSLRVSLEISLPLSSTSKLTQIVSLSGISPRLDFSCEIDWHESHKFLKVEFPLNIRAMQATYEIQFGHLQRPTHWNTSWEVAKFEVCAHKWADLSETGFGVALLNDCKYGHATHGNVMRLSLLRSAKNPDPEADMGHHSIRYALFPHIGSPQDANVIQEAYAFNEPLLVRTGTPRSGIENYSYFSVNKNSMIIETVKKAENIKNEIVLRLYESHGGRGNFRLESPLPVKSVVLCQMLEKEISTLTWNGGVELHANPFEIITLKLKL